MLFSLYQLSLLMKNYTFFWGCLVSIFVLITSSISAAPFQYKSHPINQTATTNYYDIHHLTIQQLEEKTGQRLKLKEKIALKIAIQKSKKWSKKKQISTSYRMGSSSTAGVLSFILGGVLGLIGVLLSYILFDRAQARFAWTGFAAWILLFLVLFVF